ncbi:murein biosynthesis integral membrane protein MurJ [Desulfuribacillus alkaliarsenatis]|uniref:Probable lipid II flippase MurJ n=1 Tax=Desulfuribacillus alkaliarsenatis TaxID=766136 RepID=A0A1E5G1M4_9FIRM|nr:murein biosynthesis integral membrane protein MurJ [Desulfuribacillus alkaliarsenatis]OEF96810.1 murein biosynthesis integral membrane protein MurJ [Desulfuribacillus alkaliarsenatis]
MTEDNKRTLIKSGMIILVATFLGRLFGFVREIFISAQYGTSAQAEAYFIAITIPTILIAVLPGALNSVCTPLFAEYKEKGDLKGLQRLFNTVTTLVLLGTLLLSILGGLFASQIVSVLAPGFTGEVRELTVELVTLMIPAVALIGLISIFWSYLNAQRHFLMPSLGPLVASLIVIISIFTLVPKYGIHGLTIGTVIGFFFQGIIMYPTVRKHEIQFGFGLDLKNPEVKRFFILMIPIILGMSINQLNVIVDRILGSGLEEGKFAAYIYATRIYQLPIGMFIGAVTLPLFPLLSQYASQGSIDKLISTMWSGLKMLAFIMLPVTAVVMIMGEPIVRLLFEREEFTRQSTLETNWALLFLAIGFFPYAARDLLTRVFYSLQDTRTPVIINTITITLNVIFAIILVRFLDQGGLGLAMALGGIVNLILMLFIIRYKLGVVIDRHAILQIGKIAIATVAMAITLLIAKPYFAIDTTVSTSAIEQLIQLLIPLTLACIMYLVFTLLLRVDSLHAVLRRRRNQES